MEFEDMRRILRRFDLPAEGFEDVLVEVGRLKGAALTGRLPGSPPHAPSRSAKAKGSRAA
jgi:hypothetical protein